MPRDGSGNYSLPSGNPVVVGTTITDTWANNTLSDMASALTLSLPRDGQAPPTNNLPMGAFRHLNVANAQNRNEYASAAQVQDSSLHYLTSISGTDTITATMPTTFTTLIAGMTFRFIVAGPNATTTPTLNINATGAKTITKFGNTALAAGDMQGVVQVTYDGTNYQLTNVRITASSLGALQTSNNLSELTATASTARGNISAAASGANSDITSLAGLTTPLSVAQGGTGSGTGPVLRGYLAGLTLSTTGSSATMSIAAGQAVDSTNSRLLTLAAAISKTTSAFAAGTGNGGLDTGTIANSTWYYFFEIAKSDGSAVDVTFSLSSSAPTLSGVYVGGLYRYIGGALTNGSGQWTGFTQVGDEFFWSTPVVDFNGTASTTAVSLTLSVPRGRKMKAHCITVVAASSGLYLSDLSNADLASNYSVNPTTGQSPGNGGTAGVNTSDYNTAWTNTSAQVRYRATTAQQAGIVTQGWTDYRDRI